MKENLIKRNAEEYASTKEMHRPRSQDVELDKLMIIEDYIAGVNSLDEEVSLMQNALEIQARILREMERNIQKLRNDNKDLEQALACAEDVVDTQRKELDKLRNPWISVEERLPDIGQKVITITNKGKLLLVARTTQPPHKEEGGWRWEHYIGKVTHWMPIPQIEKGE